MAGIKQVGMMRQPVAFRLQDLQLGKVLRTLVTITRQREKTILADDGRTREIQDHRHGHRGPKGGSDHAEGGSTRHAAKESRSFRRFKQKAAEACKS